MIPLIVYVNMLVEKIIAVETCFPPLLHWTHTTNEFSFPLFFKTSFSSRASVEWVKWKCFSCSNAKRHLFMERLNTWAHSKHRWKQFHIRIFLVKSSKDIFGLKSFDVTHNLQQINESAVVVVGAAKNSTEIWMNRKSINQQQTLLLS